MTDKEEDAMELDECDDEQTCPRCRGDLLIRMLQSKSDEELGISWAKYQYECDACGYRSPTWETLD